MRRFLIGMVLIACCPGGSSSNLFSKLAGGNVALVRHELPEAS